MKPYYTDGKGITIYYGDCREVLPHLPKISLVLTDPPYGTQHLGGGYGRRQLHSVDRRNGRTIVGDEDLRAISDAAPLLFAAMDDNSRLVAFCAARRMLEVHVLFQQTGFAYEGHLVWDKGNPGLGYTIRYSHEDLLVFTKGKPPAPADALISVIRASRGDIDEHPHAKPPNVWRKIMRLMPGVVLDPFMGCGTMLEAAKSLQRQAIGIEIDESYCEMAAKRLIRTPRPLLIAPSVKHAPKRRQLL